MAEQTLTIRINGDVKNFNKALNAALSETTAFDNKLTSIAKISGAAFVALSASIYGTVAAYKGKEQAELRTIQTLQATGRQSEITAKSIYDLSDALEKVTTFQDDVITEGQNIILTFRNIGAETLPRVTAAALDMATALGGDVATNARLLGKALDNPVEGMNALTKAGIRLTTEQKKMIEVMYANNNVAGAQAIILQELESRFKGAASAATGGTGAFIQLKNTFDGLAGNMGKQLVPALSAGAKAANDFLSKIKDNEGLAKTFSILQLTGTISTGVISSIAAMIVGYGKLKAGLIAAGIAQGGLALAMKGFMAASGIGLISLAISDLALNWEKRLKQMDILYKEFASNIGKTSSGISTVLSGITSFDLNKIRQGLTDIAAVAVMSKNNIAEEFERIDNETSNRESDKKSKSIQDFQEEYEAKRALRLEQLEDELGIKMSADEADLERQILADELKNSQELENINRKIQNTTDQETRLQLIKDRQQMIDEKRNQLASAREGFFSKQNLALAQATHQQLSMMAQNAATINEETGNKNAKTMFYITRAMGAMQIFINAWMSYWLAKATIPEPAGEIVGRVNLGMGIATAALVAGMTFKGPTGMAQGGLVEGGIPGVDSVPIMAQQGELMSPRQNFDEVIGSVRAKREAEKMGLDAIKYGSQGDTQTPRAEVIVTLASNALDIIETKRQGDIAIGVRRR